MGETVGGDESKAVEHSRRVPVKDGGGGHPDVDGRGGQRQTSVIGSKMIMRFVQHMWTTLLLVTINITVTLCWHYSWFEIVAEIEKWQPSKLNTSRCRSSLRPITCQRGAFGGGGGVSHAIAMLSSSIYSKTLNDVHRADRQTDRVTE